MFADAAGWNRPIWFAGGAGGHACVRDTAVEPIAWAEELIEPARAVGHPRLAALYVMASQCHLAGRIEAAVRYSDAAQALVGNDYDEVPYGMQGFLGLAYQGIGQPERSVEWFHAQLARGRDTHTLTRAALVLTLTLAGCADEAMAAATGLIDAAEPPATRVRSRSRCRPMASPAATPIPFVRVRLCVGAW